MAEFTLRPVREDDKEALIRIFSASFGDGEAFVRDLTDSSAMLPDACCAELDGEPRSCMFAFHGLSFGGVESSYLYALCTDPDYRSLGLGRAVVAYSARRAREKGARCVFLKAADRGLQQWYMSAMGAQSVSPCEAFPVRPAPSAEKALPISPLEYAALRRGPWQLPEKLLLAQDCINRHFGGAFLRLGGDCLCAEKTDRGILVRELCAEEPGAILSSAARYFGVRELMLLRPSPNGIPLLLLPSPGEEISEPPPFPFPLD